MCWGLGVSAAMVGAGGVATAVTIVKDRPVVVPITLAYFTLMEGLQAVGYLVIDQCGLPANATITLLSVLHIVFQPFFINAFAMALVPGAVSRRMRTAVYVLCGVSSAVMLLQLYPFDWAGQCRPGTTLCGPVLCTRWGDWHLAWDVPYNGLLVPIETALRIGFSFPTYMLVVFLLPIAYGAWRFALFHFLAGPFLARALTSDPNEVPAIWCLFSIGLVLIALSPWLWRRVERPPPAPA